MGVTLKRTEKEVQHAVKKLLAFARVVVYDTSQPFRAAITPGLPDLICFCPKRGLFFVEVKRDGGRLSQAQFDFGSYCAAFEVPYIVGGVTEVAEFLGIA